ncbi:GNAT family N-acetyltransferase [Patescibacteria group bacterium]|nr:GNAT family N-acetyltransferase [Patescibacteria group bacterium]
MNDLNVKFREISDNEEWYEVVQSVLRPSFFLEKDWEMKAIDLFGVSQMSHFVYRDSHIIALIKKNNKYFSIPFADIGGIFALQRGNELNLGEFKKDFFDFFGKDSNILINSFYCPIFSEQPPVLVDYILEFDGNADAVYGNFRKSLKQEIEASNVAVSVCDSARDLKKIYELYALNIRQKKNLLLPFSFFKLFLRSPEVKILISKKAENIVGFSLFAGSNSLRHYYLNATNDSGRQGKASHAMLWYEIQNCVKENIRYLDFGGTKPETGLQIFKKGWGTTAFPIYSIGSQDEARHKENILRSLWKYIPIKILPSLSRLLWRRLF